MGTSSAINVPQLPKHKSKLKKPGQRSCNEKDAKGKICAGHLKRWFYAADVTEQECGDVFAMLGPDAEVYRCEHCKTLYFPNPQDFRGLNVAGRGSISDFGLTIAPKDDKAQTQQATGHPNPPAKQADALGKK